MTKNYAEEYRHLTIRNSFMFTAVFSDPVLLTKLLARILPQEHLDPESIVIREMEIKPGYGSRAVRFDVWRKDETHLFDVEMQVEDIDFLFDRALYNSSAMIHGAIHPDSKAGYEMKQKTYVIFICAYDVNKGERLRHFTLKDQKGREESDKLNIILIGCGGKENDHEELKSFTDYVMDESKVGKDTYIQEIDERVQLKRKDPESEKAYMDWQYELNKAKREGFAEGREEGFAEGKEEGFAEGKTEERAANIRLFYRTLMEMGESPETAIQQISDGFGMTPDTVREIVSENR